MPGSGEAGDRSWTDDIQVEEKQLQEYLYRKDQGVILRQAAEIHKDKLQPTPTTISEDGHLHFGDSVMLRNELTEGLLQVDADDEVEVDDGFRVKEPGASLSTGRLITACPRTVFTLSRVDDKDGFGDSPALHYGQMFRLGISAMLKDKPMYLYASSSTAPAQPDTNMAARSDPSASPTSGSEVLVCMYPRAAAGSRWIVLPKDANPCSEPPCPQRKAVKIGQAGVLQSVATNQVLLSDHSIRMNNYGNEFRVVGGEPIAAPELATGSASGSAAGAGSKQSRPRWGFRKEQEEEAAAIEAEVAPKKRADCWSFVDSAWSDNVVAAARYGVPDVAAPHNLNEAAGDTCPGELLTNPAALADHELSCLEREKPEYAVLARLYPLLRNSGMHVIRKARRMLRTTDRYRIGAVPLRSFEGVLSWIGIRLRPGELEKLAHLFPAELGLDYQRFFAMMQVSLPEVRSLAVKDAYKYLKDRSPGGVVSVSELVRYWNPKSHPDVQQKRISEQEAQDDFLHQWDIETEDASISWEVFLDYYSDVSKAVAKDQHFIELVRSAWRLHEEKSPEPY
mmetsp:Transcript_32097/g.75345  ORF Transcript_32097/g.75345 Transcript_32097/m.75345 type:complete len:565 (+) Transcript_32097:89-1783(+)